MEKPKEPPTELLLKNMAKEYHLLDFLVKFKNEALIREEELSVKAGEIVGQIYDALLKEYGENPTPQDYKSLNKLCVRLVFCLYAEDAGLFGDSGDAFCKYLEKYQASDLRREIIDFFKVLDTPIEKRNKFLQEDLAKFPYVNGSLFAVDEDLENIPNFSEELRNILIKQAAEGFDWSDISPTIFGAVFESTLNPETRRAGGMHYTSIENIHKVIDPLFLDELNSEFKTILETKQSKSKKAKLEAFQRKLASLTFLDPACGSGNFLTETYLALRKLENQILDELYHGSTFLGSDFVVSSPIQVSIAQFYGIEINDFAVSVAKTALWIAESQTIIDTEQILNTHIDFLPLKSYSNIVEANALRIDWNSVIPKEKLNYIMGNPPFVGARLMSAWQKDDVTSIFGKAWNNLGNLDYVSCWYKRAFDFIENTNIKVGLVSTNSICQGENVANLWEPLFSNGLHFDYAYRTFLWDSDATSKAHVYCVILGFSRTEDKKQPIIYDGNIQIQASNINGYLLDLPNVFIKSRTKPICAGIPTIGIGNKPIDGGYYLFTESEKNEFIKKEPKSEKYFKKWYGSEEFVHNRPRYCLLLKDCPPSELKTMPKCLERIKLVKEYRASSKSPGTRKLSETPLKFHVENFPKSTFIIIPEVTTISRKYIPMGFMTPDVICSNLVKISSDAEIFHFGILESIVHMIWVKYVCGRLGNGYRYSKDVVYNNFVWPDVTESQKAKISKTAQAILDARALYPTSSLFELYDPLTMPPELLKAHKANDKAVLALYGFDADTSEEEIVAKLMQMYADKVKELQKKSK